MSDQIRLAVGIPAYGCAVNSAHARMWTEFGNVVGMSSERFRLTMFGMVDVNPIDRARNQLLAHAMMHNSHWLFMIDADTWVEANDTEDAGLQILRMISDADRAGAALVAAPVVKRATAEQMGLGRKAFELAVYGKPTDGDKHVSFELPWLAAQSRALAPVYAVGAACCAVNLNMIAEIEPMAEYKFTAKLSEDLDFCAQIRAKYGDGKIMVDPRVRTGHQSRSFPLYTQEAEQLRS